MRVMRPKIKIKKIEQDKEIKKIYSANAASPEVVFSSPAGVTKKISLIFLLQSCLSGSRSVTASLINYG